VMHWPSDCFAGAVLGYLIASATLRFGERLFPGQRLPQGEG
jgi:membrane-associated phospholipid phosphatase